MANPFQTAITDALNSADDVHSLGVSQWEEEGDGEWPAWFAVTDLAAASMGAATGEIAALRRRESASSQRSRPVAHIDRRLASLWFAWSLRPQAWSLPGPWDAIAGDYAAADGWIKLHTNAPHHRSAALRALNLPNGSNTQRAEVEQAVSHWNKDQLETAVVEQGGCAAAMHSADHWATHPQGQALAGEPLIHWQQDSQLQTDAPSEALGRLKDDDYPLAGVRVLDLTRVLAGPVASRFLARFGAEVLRIDPPDWAEPGVIPEVTLGKRCAGLDLTQPTDRQQFDNLLSSADILIHGYRPGALERLGYSRSRCLALNPRLLDISLCAYGWRGPWAMRRGFDSLVQMSCGIADYGMQQSNSAKPTPLPVQALDHATGYLMAAAAVRALRKLRTTGQVTSAKLSLARTALLLQGSRRTISGNKFTAESDADLDPWLEQTSWGTAQRIRFPARVSETQQSWQIAASDIRSSPANWQSARSD